MEDLAPPLRFVLTLRMGIENGQSIQSTIRQFIEEFPSNSFSILLEQWLTATRTHSSPSLKHSSQWTPWSQIVLDIVHLGLKGNPILEDIKQLEKDLAQACEDQIQRELQTLPFIALIPILFCQFPAYLVLLLGPWLGDLIDQLS